MRDPEDEFAIRDLEQYKWLQSLPVCDDCGEAIQDEYYYEIDGNKYCDRCVRSHKRWID